MLVEFKDVLKKIQNVQFWTIKEKMSKKEKSIYREAPVYADYIDNLEQKD